MAYMQNPNTELTQEDVEEIKREACAELLDQIEAYKVAPDDYSPESIIPSDFEHLFQQLDDDQKVTYLLQALDMTCKYLPEYHTPLEIVAWKMGLVFIK